jgi:hypothetical protein
MYNIAVMELSSMSALNIMLSLEYIIIGAVIVSIGDYLSGDFIGDNFLSSPSFN